MRSGRRDEDVDREVAVERRERSSDSGRERRLALPGLEHGAEERRRARSPTAARSSGCRRPRPPAGRRPPGSARSRAARPRRGTSRLSDSAASSATTRSVSAPKSMSRAPGSGVSSGPCATRSSTGRSSASRSSRTCAPRPRAGRSPSPMDYRIRAVTDVLICADSMRSPEMRHEVPVAIPDAFPLCRAGRAAGRGRQLTRGGAHQRGGAGHRGDPAGARSAPTSSCRAACRVDEMLLRVVRARVPGARDRERRRAADVPARARRPPARRRDRRARRPRALRRCGGGARTRRRSRGCAARSARARPRSTSRARCCATRRCNGTLVLDGEPLTCERIKMEVERVFGEHGAFADEFIVSHGAQTAIGHEAGHGAILAGEPIVFDLFPRDRATGVYTDMTRTYVVGDAAGGDRRVPPPLQGGARPRRRRGEAGRERPHADEDRRATSSRSTATRRSSRRSRARCSTAASSTASATASASRCTSVRISRASATTSSPGDVIALEPGLYRAGLRRRPARGHRDRHGTAAIESSTDYPYDARAMSEHAIETMLLEERRYPPPPEFAAQANAQPEIYDERFEAFWEREGRGAADVVRAVHRAVRVGAAVREVVPRRHAQRLLQLRRPARRGRQRRQGRLPLGGRAGGRAARDHVRGAAARRRALRERAQEARRRQGHAGRDLHGHGSRAAGRDARVHAARRAAHVVFGGFSADSLSAA